MAKKIKQYGTWSSPISPAMLAEKPRIYNVNWDTISETLVWSASRGGKTALLAQTGVDAPRQLNGDGMPVRGRVGYGGGGFTVNKGTVYFVSTSGRLYRVPVVGGQPRPITPAFGGASSPVVSPDGQWIAYAHTYEGRDGLALVDTEGQHWPRKLAFGSDFVMQPAWHATGTYLAFIRWNHPQMPWDGTELCLAMLQHDHAGVPYVDKIEVITGDSNTAVFQPEFSPDGRYLSYVSDASGYGQIYVYDLIDQTHTMLTHTEAEHMQPAWVQGMRVYGWQADGTGLYFLRNKKGIIDPYHYDMFRGEERRIKALDHYTHIEQIAVSQLGRVAMIGSSTRISARVVSYAQAGGERVHSRAGRESVPVARLAMGHPIEWKGHDGETVHGLHYPPASERHEGAGAPPLVVIIHGGPTTQQTAGYEPEAQFFATRGYAVLYVNHRGSTGYGKAYKDMLAGNWGVYDVEDAVSGAQHLIEQEMADPERVVIMGGSAGGFTALQSLVAKPGFYKAGIVRYGIGNQFMLVQETHKFEERYSDTLLGSLPQAAEIYRERSPLFHADQIQDPLLIFQGADDDVVPKNQSDDLVAALQANGVPHEYHVYEGEGHGFRQPENIKHYYQAILKFLSQYVIYA